MQLRVDALLYANKGNENFGMGHIKCSPGPCLAYGLQVPHP